MPEQLTDLGRRTLSKLPVYAKDEAAHVEAEGGPDVSVRSYTLAEFTVRCAEDPAIQPPLSEAQVHVTLEALAAKGLAVERKDGWKMTKAGFDALHAPVEDEEQTPGAVTVGLHPAVAEADAHA
jgi:hypothetical protein